MTDKEFEIQNALGLLTARDKLKYCIKKYNYPYTINEKYSSGVFKLTLIWHAPKNFQPLDRLFFQIYDKYTTEDHMATSVTTKFDIVLQRFIYIVKFYDRNSMDIVYKKAWDWVQNKINND